MFEIIMTCPHTGKLAETGLRVPSISEINVLPDGIIRIECAACGALHDCCKDDLFILIDGVRHGPTRPSIN